MTSIKNDNLLRNLSQNDVLGSKCPTESILVFGEITPTQIQKSSTKPSLQNNNKIRIENSQQLKIIEVKQQLEQEIIKQPQNKRIEQFLFSFIISLIIPMVNSTLITSMMIQLKDVDTVQKSWTCIGISIFMALYFTIQTIVRFGFVKYLQYYFYPDRLLPGAITSSFAYFAMTKEVANLHLYNKFAQVTFAFWFFIMAGNLRVCLKEYNWTRKHIFISKLAYLYCGTTILYSGVCYIYTGVHSRFPALVRDHIKDLVLLFIFGTVDALYQHYKFISNFDGTEKLIPPINFEEFQRKQFMKQKTKRQITRLMKKIQKNKIYENIQQ